MKNIKIFAAADKSFKDLKNKYLIRMASYNKQILNCKAEEKEAILEGLEDTKSLIINLESEQKILAGLYDKEIKLYTFTDEDGKILEQVRAKNHDSAVAMSTDPGIDEMTSFYSEELYDEQGNDIPSEGFHEEADLEIKSGEMQDRKKKVKDPNKERNKEEKTGFRTFKQWLADAKKDELPENASMQFESDVENEGLSEEQIVAKWAKKLEEIPTEFIALESESEGEEHDAFEAVWEYFYPQKLGEMSVGDVVKEDRNGESLYVWGEMTWVFFVSPKTLKNALAKFKKEAAYAPKEGQFGSSDFLVDGQEQEVSLEDLQEQFEAAMEGMNYKYSEDAMDLKKNGFYGEEDFNAWLAERLESGIIRKASKDENNIAMSDLEGGKVKDKPEEAFTPESIQKGIEVEKEHTNNEEIAKKIALDHLSEDPMYYDKLTKMEAGDYEGLEQLIKKEEE